MPNFKPKAKKKFKVNKKKGATLDGKHNEKMLEFDNIKNKIIPQLIQRKRALQKQLTQNISLEDKLDIEDEIKELSSLIKQKKKKKVKYLLGYS